MKNSERMTSSDPYDVVAQFGKPRRTSYATSARLHVLARRLPQTVALPRSVYSLSDRLPPHRNVAGRSASLSSVVGKSLAPLASCGFDEWVHVQDSVEWLGNRRSSDAPPLFSRVGIKAPQ